MFTSTLRSARTVLLVVALCVAGSTAQAAPFTFVLDDSASQIALAASINDIALEPQGPGSLETTYAGEIEIDYVPGSITLLTALIDAQPSGDWQPGIMGAMGTAPADYGMMASDFPVMGVLTHFAMRELVFNAASSSLALVGGSFGAAGVDFSMTSGAVDFRNPLSADRLDLSAFTTPMSTSGTGSLTAIGTDATLAIPINIAATIDLVPGAISMDLRATGRIVARATVPEPGAVGILLLGGLLALPRGRSV